MVYHNDVGFDKTFSDPEWGKTTALSMIDKGADVIFGAGGKTGNGALLACAEKGVLRDRRGHRSVSDRAGSAEGHADQRHETHRPRRVQPDQGCARWRRGLMATCYGQAALAPYHDVDSKVPADVKAKIDEITKRLPMAESRPASRLTKPAQ